MYNAYGDGQCSTLFIVLESSVENVIRDRWTRDFRKNGICKFFNRFVVKIIASGEYFSHVPIDKRNRRLFLCFHKTFSGSRIRRPCAADSRVHFSSFLKPSMFDYMACIYVHVEYQLIIARGRTCGVVWTRLCRPRGGDGPRPAGVFGLICRILTAVADSRTERILSRSPRVFKHASVFLEPKAFNGTTHSYWHFVLRTVFEFKF